MAVRAPRGLSRRLLTSFDGGLNLRDAAGEVRDNESPDMMNVTLDERGGVVKRLGYQRDNAEPIFQADTALASSTSGNEITDTIRATNTEGDGWPYYPYSFDAQAEANFVSATGTEPWTAWEGLSGQVANQLFFGGKLPTELQPRQGQFWIKYKVRPGDKFGASSGERSEHLDSNGIDGDGQEVWYRWSSYFGTDFVRPSGWCIFTQFHSDARFAQAAFKWQVDKVAGEDYLSLVLTNGPFDDATDALNPDEADNHRFTAFAPVSRGKWHDFIVRNRYAGSANGLVQMWHRLEGSSNYSQVINEDAIYTLPVTIGDPTPGSILPKQGLYRNDEPSITNEVYHDGFARGNAYAEMLYTYTPPAAMGRIGIWPATTNMLTNGGFETNTTNWAAFAGGTTITRVNTKKKFGTWSLEVATDGTSGSAAAQYAIALVNGTKYTASCWVWASNGDHIRIWALDSLSTNLGQTAVSGTGDWQKVSVTFTATANNNHNLRIGRTSTGSAYTFWIDGVQLEAQSTATPYKHTDGATATRNAARIQYSSTPLNATTGYVAIDWLMGWRSTVGIGNLTGDPTSFEWFLDANNYIRCWYEESAAEWRLERKAAGASTTVAYKCAHAARQRMVVIASWSATQIKLSLNGFPFRTAANTNIPSGLPANFDVGSQAGTSNHIGADKKWIAFGATELTDAQARTLGESYANPFSTITATNLYYSEAQQQLFIQLGTKLYKRTSANTYVEIQRAGPADAFTTAKVVGFADMGGNVYVAHPDDGILKYTGSGNISVVNSTAKGNSLATWQNKLWATGVNSTVWWSNAGNGDTWTTATDFIQIRDINDDACTALGFGQSLDSGSVPASGLLVFKRYSTHRIDDSQSGRYVTLSAEAGAAGPKAVAHLTGLTMCVNDKGVWVTDGEKTSINVSEKVQPLFTPNSLAMTSTQNIACGIHRDRFVISLARAGQSSNDLTLEYHPEVGWFAPHSFGMQAYAVHKLQDASLYGMTTDANPNLAKVFTGGSDDALHSGTPGDDIDAYFRTRWFEPVNGSLTRLRRMRLQSRGSWTLNIRKDFRFDAGEDVANIVGATTAAALYGVAVYGQAYYGAVQSSGEKYDDVYSLGFANAWQFTFRQEGNDVSSLAPLLGSGAAPETGGAALYELHLDYVPLTYA